MNASETILTVIGVVIIVGVGAWGIIDQFINRR